MTITSDGFTQSPPPPEAPAGVRAVALRAPSEDVRKWFVRRVETSALATDHHTRTNRLTFTIGVVAAFALATWAVRAAADTGPGTLLPFVVPIALATWHGGIGQGLLATALSGVAGYAVADAAPLLAASDAWALLFLVVVAAVVVFATDGLRASVVRANDVAETRRRLLAAVVASEERWRAFNESVPALMSESASDGTMTYCNARWLEYTGLTFEQLHEDPLACVHPDDRDALDEAWRNAIASATPLEAEWRILRHDGAYRWHYGIAIPAHVASDRPTAWVSVNVDIDARKRAEAEALFHREMHDQTDTRARLAMLAAHLESWVGEIEDSRITVMHRDVSAGGELRPWERWEDWLAHVHPHDREALDAAVRECVAMRQELDADFRTAERNRAARWMHVWGRVVYEDDQPRRLIAVQQDVTEHKRAEETAREGEEHLRRLADANIIGVASGVGDVITEANDNFLSMLGYTRDDLAEHRLRWEGLTPPGEERIEGDLFTELLRRGASEPRRREFVSKEGDMRHVLAGTLLLERRPFRWVTFSIDLTDQVNAEEAVHEALLEAEEANASKDEFVALVAHELRAPITTIAGNAEVLEKRAPLIDSESRASALADIRSEADRLRRMIQDLLVLARLERRVEMEAEPMRIERVVRDVASRHQRSYPERVLAVSMPDRMPLVLASAAYTDQVISNLLANAEKYSPRGRPVEVSLDAEDGVVRVRVLDNGVGIAPEEMDQVFRPFYRSRNTSTRAEGFGIGLTVCRRLVEAQGGEIWATARPQGGTEFGFTLPVASEDQY